VLPSADLQRLDPAVLRSEDPRVRGTFGRSMDTTRLVAFLESNRAGERFLLATTTTRIAAPIIIATGEPVMAMGGFHGLDKAITPEQLAQRVAAREVRFVMLGDAAPPSRRMGADAALEPLSRWVREQGRRIEGARWRAETMPRGLALYDMRREIY
jgi:4-amino-4-deoxy-L-arabinose transferase-like glycosyltransferase